MIKIIFSRKGLDSTAGGIPSPKKGKNIQSLPIPYKINTLTSYEYLGFGKEISQLSKNKIKPSDTCHYDPNLETGQFGQVGAAQTHLENNKVGIGDIFLFWGWFRETVEFQNKISFSKTDPGHYRMFGWFQIGKIIKLGDDPSWYSKEKPNPNSHPHTIGKWKKNNTLYIAKKNLEGFELKNFPGFGKFKATKMTNLSFNPLVKKSKWICPQWLNPKHGGCGMSYHKNLSRWKENTVDIVGRGQEFVAKPKNDKECKKWLMSIFQSADLKENINV